MRTLFKLIRGLLLLLVVSGVALYFARNLLARHVVQLAVTKLTRFPLEIGSVNLQLREGVLEVHDLRISNPPEFHGGTFVVLPLLRMDYDTMSFVRRTPHIRELVVHVSEVVLVKNEKGETNANVLQDRAASLGGDTGKSPETTGGGAPPKKKKTPYRVDVMKVRVGTVTKRTFNAKGQSSENKFTLNLDATYRNVTESTSVSQLVMQTVFGQIGNVAGDMIKGVGTVLKGAADTLQKTTKGLFGIFQKKP